MTDSHSDDLLDDGCNEDFRTDPRFPRYLEYCASVKDQGLPCPSFREWIIQSEEGY